MPEHQQIEQSKKPEPTFQKQANHVSQSPVLNPFSIIQRARINPKSLSHADVMQLQRTIGNRAVGKSLSGMGKLPSAAQHATVQRQEIPEEEEPLQTKRENDTGMPDNLKAGVESLSRMDMSDVKVHYNSSKPAEVGALAYTQGTNIHVAPGQEKHLPHEAWHVVQQAQGRVKPTMQLKGVAVNDDEGLEREADVMGVKAVTHATRLQGAPEEQELLNVQCYPVECTRPDTANVSHSLASLLSTARFPSTAPTVQRSLRINGIPVLAGRIKELEDACKDIFMKKGKTWGEEQHEALRHVLESRTDNFDAPSSDKVAEAIENMKKTQSGFTFPPWFSFQISPTDLDKAHQTREKLRFLAFNDVAQDESQMREEGSAFHSLPKEKLVPLSGSRYGWAKLGGQTVTVHERGKIPAERLSLTPFGDNSPSDIGYIAWVGDNTTGRQLGHLFQQPKGRKRKAPSRSERDEVYGGWENVPDLTIGHSDPWRSDKPILGPSPTKRRKGDNWKGTETFTPKFTSQHPQNFYAENTPWGEGIRNSAIEAPIVTKGGWWLQSHSYSGQTVTDSSSNAVPTPETVHITASFNSTGSMVYASFPNAADTDYMVDSTTATGGKVTHGKLTPKQMNDRNRRKKLGKIGAHGHLKGHGVAASNLPQPFVFDPSSFGGFNPSGAYGQGQTCTMPSGYGAPSYDPPPSPLLTGAGMETKTMTLKGRWSNGQRVKDPNGGDDWIVDLVNYDVAKDESICNLQRCRQYTDSF